MKRVKFGVSGYFPENTWRKWQKFCTLVYLDHLQNWLVYDHGLLIFLIFALFGLSEMGQIWGFRVFPGEHMEEMAPNFARWCILNLQNNLWSRSAIFLIFGLSETNLGFPGISRRTHMAWNFAHWCIHRTSLWSRSADFSNFCVTVKRVIFPGEQWRKWPKFCTLMYLDHLQNWLVYGLDLWIGSHFGAILT